MAALSKAQFIPCSSEEKPVSSTVSFYSVQAGDTLWAISRKYNVDLQTLMLNNNLNSKSILKVGQRLIISSEQERFHIIRKGETLWDIALHYNVPLDQLQKMNPDKQPNKLRIGDRITLPEGASAIALATNTTQQPSRSIMSRFAWPLKGTITSRFGWRSSGFHHGMDIAGDIGEVVTASAEGVVSFTGYKGVYGNTIIIDHSGNMQTLYAHLNRIYVSQGEKVTRGEIIGTVGNTGRSTGPHLHFEVRRDDKSFDPLIYLR